MSYVRIICDQLKAKGENCTSTTFKIEIPARGALRFKCTECGRIYGESEFRIISENTNVK